MVPVTFYRWEKWGSQKTKRCSLVYPVSKHQSRNLSPVHLSSRATPSHFSMRWGRIQPWKWKWKPLSLSHVRLFGTPWTVACQAPLSMGCPRQAYWSGLPCPSPSPAMPFSIPCHALPQGIFLTQRPSPGLLLCRQILHCLSHWRSPRPVLFQDWVRGPFSKGSPSGRQEFCPSRTGLILLLSLSLVFVLPGWDLTSLQLVASWDRSHSWNHSGLTFANIGQLPVLWTPGLASNIAWSTWAVSQSLEGFLLYRHLCCNSVCCDGIWAV